MALARYCTHAGSNPAPRTNFRLIDMNTIDLVANMNALYRTVTRPATNRVEPLNSIHTKLCNEFSILEDYCADNDVPQSLLDMRDRMSRLLDKIEVLTFKSK